jgi:hypothetical protein
MMMMMMTMMMMMMTLPRLLYRFHLNDGCHQISSAVEWGDGTMNDGRRRTH